MNMKFLKDIINGALQVIGAVFDYASSCLKKSAAKNDMNTEQINSALKESRRYDLMPNYNAVGNAVYKCLIDNHSQCGLCRPQTIEGVIYSNLDKAIDMNPAISTVSGVIFRFEAKRIVSDLYMGGMRKYEYPQVPVEDIEIKLGKVLPKYMQTRGYSYFRMEVLDDDNDTVSITLYGVYKLNNAWNVGMVL